MRALAAFGGMRIARPGVRPLADFSPANFAIVMATGILGIAAHQQGHQGLALLMLVLSALGWLVIAALTLARLLLHRARLIADLRSHQRAFGFFTAVAGTCVLGSQLVVLGVAGSAGVALAWLGFVLWIVLTYGILIALTIQPDKPVLAEGISGAWLLTVVATQSLAVLACLLAATTPEPATRLALCFGALALWLCGGMVYLWVISLIFYRYAFFAFAPKDLAPTYWINMGAMAISALAGTLLVLAAPGVPLLAELLPFLKGGTLLYWAVGTWWVPMLAGLAAWRYIRRRYPLRYDVTYWGAVFPLGMYAAASHQMALALDLHFLEPLARGFFYLGMAAWLLTTLGLARHLLRLGLGSDGTLERNRG